MRWLLHGNFAPAIAEALRARGDTVNTPADLQIAATDPVELLKAARQKQLDVITSDSDVTSAAFGVEVRFDRSLVLVADPSRADAVQRLFERYKRLTPGRLYTITGTRVKVRQLPAT